MVGVCVCVGEGGGGVDGAVVSRLGSRERWWVMRLYPCSTVPPAKMDKCKFVSGHVRKSRAEEVKWNWLKGGLLT